MQLTDSQRVAARKFLERLRAENPGQSMDLMLEAGIMGYRQENNPSMVQVMEVVRQVYYEDEASRQNASRQNAYRQNVYGNSIPEGTSSPLKFSHRMFWGLVMMVLFVAFCAGYEGARRAFLAKDVNKVIEIDSRAEKVESQLDSFSGDRDLALANWRESAKLGQEASCRNLGLLCLTGRGGVEDPRSEPVMLRTWNVFAFAFYFGMVVIAYYIIRPIFLMSRKKRGCVSTLVFMMACLATTYFPGMIVFHYARQWYPAFSAWMTKIVGTLLQ